MMMMTTLMMMILIVMMMMMSKIILIAVPSSMKYPQDSKDREMQSGDVNLIGTVIDVR